MLTEKDVQRAIIEALLYDGYLILRINQGGRHDNPGVCAACSGTGLDCWQCKGTGKSNIKTARYTRFAHWQQLGIDQQDSGISDVIAMKGRTTVAVSDGDDVQFLKYPVEDIVLLAIEVKAPGKKGNVTEKQQAFLDAITEHGGIAIVADCLEDVAPYLDRARVQ